MEKGTLLHLWWEYKLVQPLWRPVCCCCCQVTSAVSNSVRAHRWQPTRLLCPRDSPSKNSGVGCHFFLQCMHECMLSRSSHVQLCVTPWTAAHQAPLSIGFSRQEYWSGLPFPSPGVQCGGSLKIELPYDPVILLLGIYPEKNMVPKDTCTPMFTAAMFIIAKTWKQPKCPPTEEWLKKMWYMYIMEYYSAIRKNEIRCFAATFMDLECVI